MAFSLTGCFGSDSSPDNNLVWNSYSNSYYGIKYPDQWQKKEYDSGAVNFYLNEKVEFFIEDVVQTDKSLEELKNSVIQSEIGQENVDSKDLITFKGQSAYKIIVSMQIDGEQIKGKIIITKKDNKILQFGYSGNKTEYENNLNIANEMFDSIELY